MTKKKKKLKPKSEAELFRSIRKGWHGVKPVQKADRDRTKYKRSDFKKKEKE